MKRKLLAVLLCVAMVMSLLPANAFAVDVEAATEEADESYSITGIVIANERYALETNEKGETFSIPVPYLSSGESAIYYTYKMATGVMVEQFFVIDRALDDDMLGTKVTVSFTADRIENNGYVDYMNVEVVGDVILHEDTVVYTVPAINTDIMPNGESTSSTEIRPYISFTVDGVEKQVVASENMPKIAKKVDAQTDTNYIDYDIDGDGIVEYVAVADAMKAEFARYAYVVNGDVDDDGDLEYASAWENAAASFMADFGVPTLSQYRFVSVDGGNTYSYIFKSVSGNVANYIGDNAGYGYVTAYNRAAGTIRISGLVGLDISDVTINGKISVDDPVVFYRESGKIVIEPVEVFNAAVEDFTDDNGVVLNGNVYYVLDNNANYISGNIHTDYYYGNPGAMNDTTKYFTYGNLIIRIEPNDTVATDGSNYAVVLQSYYDAAAEEAFVKLGFADDTEGTYKVGKAYTANSSDTADARNNRMIDFANNSAFGYVLKYTILSDGTVDLSAQDLKAVNDSNSTLRTFRDGGEVTYGKFNNIYPYSDDTIIYALYGNPGYYVDGTNIAIDTDAYGYAPVKSKAFKLSELKDLHGECIENLVMASFIDGTIEYAHDAVGSYVVDTVTKANRYVVVGAMTVGDNLSGIMYRETDSLAYVVEATQRYNSATQKYYAELTLINEDGLITAVTVDDVKDLTGCSVLESEYLGTLDEFIGGFVRFGMDDDGKIDVLDTYGNEVETSFDAYAYYGLYLVNLTQNRNGIISFYDTDADVEIGWEAATSLKMHEDGCELIGIDGNKYAGEKLTFVSKYVTSLPADEGGNAVIQIEDGQVVRIFSFTPNYVVDGELSDFDEIEEGSYEDLSWNFTYGAATYCSEEKDIIKIIGAMPVEGTYKLSDLTVRGDVASDSLVVCYKDGEDCVIEAVETVTGDIEEFTSDGVVVGGNEYHLWPESEIAYNYSSFFEFWSDTKGGFTSNTKFFVHDNFILDVELDEAPAPIENYAVILNSYYDENEQVARVRLGFTDGTSGNYAVGKLSTPVPADLSDMRNNKATDFADNRFFGLVVQYKILANGTVDLSAQDFNHYNDTGADFNGNPVKNITVQPNAGKVVSDTKFQNKFAFNEKAVVFALYGNPGDSDVCAVCGEINNSCSGVQHNYKRVAAGTSITHKVYRLSELESLTANAINGLAVAPGAYMMTSGAVFGSYVVNTTKTQNNYIVAAAVTVGSSVAMAQACYDYGEANVGYVVDAAQKYNVKTDKYYVELTLISKNGKISTKTVDDVPGYSSQSFLGSYAVVGKLNWLIGTFVSYVLDDEGIICVLDTIDKDEWFSYDVCNSFDPYSWFGVFLVNAFERRGDVLFFYDTDSDVDIKQETAMAARISERGCDVIGINAANGEYTGETLSFIPSHLEFLSKEDGLYYSGSGAGNAVIFINEGEIETIFSFNNNEYATIYYDLNGGEGRIPSFTKRTGTDVALSTIVPTREGYIFKGWAEDADADVAEYQPGDIFSGDADVTLYAVWKLARLTGDANDDGNVDFLDAMIVLKHDAEIARLTGDNLLAADTNADGNVDFLDAIRILKYDAELITDFN